MRTNVSMCLGCIVIRYQTCIACQGTSLKASRTEADLLRRLGRRGRFDVRKHRVTIGLHR